VEESKIEASPPRVVAKPQKYNLSIDELIEYGLPLPPEFNNEPEICTVGRMIIKKNRDIGHGSNSTIVYEGFD
jgi:hypothetical protein